MGALSVIRRLMGPGIIHVTDIYRKHIYIFLLGQLVIISIQEHWWSWNKRNLQLQYWLKQKRTVVGS